MNKNLFFIKREIPLSKTKILLAIVGSLLFVLLGGYLFLTAANPLQMRYNPILLKSVGVASILLFGATGIYGVKKMFDKNIGLTIDDIGIIDNTNASSVGLIKWVDITAVQTQQVASSKFILIYTSNPDFYLDKTKGLKKKILEANNRMYGTPFSITSNTLNFNSNALEKILNESLEQHRKTDAQ